MSPPPSFLTGPPREGDLGPVVIGVGAMSIAVSTIAVALRFWSRAGGVSSLTFWWDDWIVLATTVVSHAFLALNMAWTRIGLGKHIESVPMDSLLPSIYHSKASILLYAVSIWLVKLSALLLFARIFRQSPRFRATLWVFGAAVSGWFVCTAVIPWFNCNPVRKTLDPMVPGTCFERMNWYYASAFINAFFDLAILVLPMPLIWKLQMTLRKKISITVVFVVGYCSAFLSFARFIIIIRDPEVMSVNPEQDPYWHTIPLLILSMLEAPFAIVALCGPAVGQLATRAAKSRSLSSLLNLFSTRGSRSGSGSGSGRSGRSGLSKGSRSDYDGGVERTISYKVDYYKASASTPTKSSSEGGWARNHNKPGFGSTTAFAAARRESAESQAGITEPAIALTAVAPATSRDLEAQQQERSMVWGQ